MERERERERKRKRVNTRKARRRENAAEGFEGNESHHYE